MPVSAWLKNVSKIREIAAKLALATYKRAITVHRGDQLLFESELFEPLFPDVWRTRLCRIIEQDLSKLYAPAL